MRRILPLLPLFLLLAVLLISFASAYRKSRQNRLNEALFTAMRARDTPAALSAITSGADPNAMRTWDAPPPPPPLWKEVWRILRHEPAPTPDMPAPGMAARLGLTEVASALLARGANVNLPDANGTTPLMEAARSWDLALLALLAQYHADGRQRDNDGYTALTYMRFMDWLDEHPTRERKLRREAVAHLLQQIGAKE